MDAQPDGQINVRADEEMDGRTDEQMDGWMDRGAEGTSLTEISASLLASQIRTDILAHLAPTVTNLPGDLIPQINAALTQFYKFAMGLSSRLELLEKEPGLELQPMEAELDLQSLQIDQDAPVESYVHADLEFVRASIFEGKPDKESVRQWLQRERKENPGQSYATLAETLNLAGIPTLSGRDTWNRGTLRNLLTER